MEAAQNILELNIVSDDLDRNPWLLNVKNGTIGVLSGEFREHRQEDMITKIANVVFDPQADCLLWKQFFREIMNYKTDIISFVQTVAGWAFPAFNSPTKRFPMRHSLSISIEHFPEGIGKVFFFFPKMLIVK